MSPVTGDRVRTQDPIAYGGVAQTGTVLERATDPGIHAFRFSPDDATLRKFYVTDNRVIEILSAPEETS